MTPAHRRFLWIYPFLDRNCRVARLMSRAMLLEGSVPLFGRSLMDWCVVRPDKAAAPAADERRKGDLDGQGRSIAECAHRFLPTLFENSCLDQFRYIRELLEPSNCSAEWRCMRVTTQEAAELLNVSQPFLIGLLENGQLPHYKVGTHRHVRSADLMIYKRRRDAESEAALRECATLSQDMKLGT